MDLQFKGSDEDLKGRFSNAAQVRQHDDHFFVDFFLASPPVGQLVSRIILTPGHLKQLEAVIREQLKVYEDTHGKIDKTEPSSIGFRTA